MGRKIFLCFLIVLLFLPIYWMFVGSISTGKSTNKIPPDFFPADPTSAGYRILLAPKLLPLWISNTVLITILSSAGAVIVTTAAGFALATKPKGWRIITACMIGGILIPRSSLLVPLFLEMKAIGLSGNFGGAIVPVLYYPAGVLLATGYFRSVPIELFEEARLSGGTDIDVLRYIAIPSAGPIVGLIALAQGTMSLGDYLWQSLVLRYEHQFTYVVGLFDTIGRLSNQVDKYVNQLGVQCAAGIMIMLPFIVLYIFTSRHFTQDSLKGLR